MPKNMQNYTKFWGNFCVLLTTGQCWLPAPPEPSTVKAVFLQGPRERIKLEPTKKKKNTSFPSIPPVLPNDKM